MTREQTIDLTDGGPWSEVRHLTIRTEAGIVRVNTRLVDTQTQQSVVTVEVEPNTTYSRKTAPGGSWSTSTREIYERTEVRLLREGD